MEQSAMQHFPLSLEKMEWVFRQKRIIRDERIHSISLENTVDRYVSKSCYYSIEYSPARPQQAPSRVFVKTYNSGLSGELTGKKEVEFYSTFPDLMPDFNFLDCYYGHYNCDDSSAYLIFKDVRNEIRLPQNLDLKHEPRKKELEQVIKFLADFHAFWWDHDQLGETIGSTYQWGQFNRYMDINEERYFYFKNLLKHRLPDERRKILEQILIHRERFFNRLNSGKNLTIGHCDPNIYNVLWPHESGKEHFYIIDWNYWQVHLGAHDLAYLLSLTLNPEIRRSLEMHLIKHYHECLLSKRIQYSWDDFLFDYKISFASILFTPIALCSWKLPFMAWWPQYKNCFSAFEDLNAREVFA